MKINLGYMKNLAHQVDAAPAGWFKKWFDSSFYHQLYAHRSQKEAADFIDELLDKLQPEPTARMLDLGCGAGRHAKFLASKGFNVTGLDLAGSSIQAARQHENTNLQFYRHDMCVPFGMNYFDYVFNFFTSFGYFDTDAENHDVIRNIANSLKPGGILVMDYLNVAYSEAHLVPREEKEIDGIAYHISRHADEKHFYKKIVIDNLQADGPFEYTERVAKLSWKDFKGLFEAHGLTLLTAFGDYQLNDYDVATSPRLILHAQKKTK
jgi:SAM-dependent methyltransferase